MVACWVILLQQENWNASWENLMLGVSARRWWACQAAACGMAWQGCLFCRVSNSPRCAVGLCQVPTSMMCRCSVTSGDLVVLLGSPCLGRWACYPAD